MAAILAGVALVAGAAHAEPSPTTQASNVRQVYVCTSANLPDSLKAPVADFIAHADTVPLIAALRKAGDAGDAVAMSSESLLPAKAFNKAANNHLIIIGLLSKDALLEKAFGFNATVDDQQQTAYSLGWGYFKGDIGWVESDRNPFMHSQQIHDSSHDTVQVIITGTSEAGVLAALNAFEHGMINGFVPVGDIQRPQTTILDRDPSLTSVPTPMPESIQIDDKPAALAGWNQLPEQEYRIWLEVGGFEPVRLWRLKYLPENVMEDDPSKRGLEGLHPMDYGNACTIAQFESASDAEKAAEAIAAQQHWSKAKVEGVTRAWSAPQATDETVSTPYWTITVLAADRYVMMSTLPAPANAEIAQRLNGKQ